MKIEISRFRSGGYSLKTVLVSMLVLLCFSFEGRAQFSKLTIGDYGIQSIVPTSMTSVRGAVWADIHNSMQGFKVTGIRATVYDNGQPFVTGAANDVYVAAGSQRVVVSGEASLCPGVSIWSVLKVLFFDPKDYSVDLSLTITLDSGESRTVVKNNLPVTVLLKLM